MTKTSAKTSAKTYEQGFADGYEACRAESPAQECVYCKQREVNFDDDIIVDGYEIKLYNELNEYPDNSKDA